MGRSFRKGIFESEEYQNAEIIPIEELGIKHRKITIDGETLELGIKYLEITFNGETLEEFNGADGVFYIDEFIRSVYEIESMGNSNGPLMSGVYDFYSCECGEPGCEGWWDGVIVEKSDDKIFWSIFDHVKKPIKLMFNIDDYLALGRRIEMKINQMSGL